MIWCHLFRRETLVKVPGWHPPPPFTPMFTLWTARELLSKALRIPPSQDWKPDLHIYSLIISCHQTCFCSCSQAKGLKSCFTKESLLLGNLSSELLQPGSSLLLYLGGTMTITGNEHMTLDIVIDWLTTRRFLACFLLSLNWRQILTSLM